MEQKMKMTMFILPSIDSAPLMIALLSPGYALPIAGPPQPLALLVPLELVDTLASGGLQALATPTPTLAPAGIRDADTPTRPPQQLPSLQIDAKNPFCPKEYLPAPIFL